MAETSDFIEGGEEEEEFIVCDICNLLFNNVKTYELHKTGSKHLKKEKTLKNKELLGKSNDASDDDENDQIICKVCDKTFSGVVPFQQHLKSGPHAKAVRRQRLLDKTPSENVDDEQSDASSSEKLIPKAYAECSLCKKKFSGPESFRDHIISKAHKKKRKEAKNLEEFLKSSNADNNEVKSETKNETSQIETLKKQLLETAEDTLSDGEESDDKKLLSCEQCGKSFTGPSSLLQHLVSKLHKKKLKQLKILSELASKMNLTDDNTASEENEDTTDEEKDGELLACVTCSMSFSGPESMMAHLNGRGHRKKVSYLKAKAKILRKFSGEGMSVSRKQGSLDRPSTTENDEQKPSTSAAAVVQELLISEAKSLEAKAPKVDLGNSDEVSGEKSSDIAAQSKSDTTESKDAAYGSGDSDADLKQDSNRKKRSNLQKAAKAVIEIINEI